MADVVVRGKVAQASITNMWDSIVEVPFAVHHGGSFTYGCMEFVPVHGRNMTPRPVDDKDPRINWVLMTLRSLRDSYGVDVFVVDGGLKPVEFALWEETPREIINSPLLDIDDDE